MTSWAPDSQSVGQFHDQFTQLLIIFPTFFQLVRSIWTTLKRVIKTKGDPINFSSMFFRDSKHTYCIRISQRYPSYLNTKLLAVHFQIKTQVLFNTLVSNLHLLKTQSWLCLFLLASTNLFLTFPLFLLLHPNLYSTKARRHVLTKKCYNNLSPVWGIVFCKGC